MSHIDETRALMREYLADMAALKPFADQDQKNELNQAFATARAEAKKAAIAYIAAVKAG